MSDCRPYYYGDYWGAAPPSQGPTYTFPSGPVSMINAAPPALPFSWLTEAVGTYEVVLMGLGYMNIGGGLVPQYQPPSINPFIWGESLWGGPDVLS